MSGEKGKVLGGGDGDEGGKHTKSEINEKVMQR